MLIGVSFLQVVYTPALIFSIAVFYLLAFGVERIRRASIMNDPRYSAEVPLGFICPISQEIMTDPYVDTDGNSYEHSCIMEWLQRSSYSPITRNYLDPDKLVPNRILKSLIEEFKAKNTTFEGKQAEEKESEGKAASKLLRKPIILYAVIDNSGSMSDSCGANATGENDGYSRLDLVKHTLSTMITALTDEDQICVIKFSTVAAIFSKTTRLTAANKKILIQRLEHLEPEGQTNIWDGLRHAMDLVGELDYKTCMDHSMEIFLLTDGEPNLNPPGDMIETIRDYMARKCVHVAPKIHTFGYGYRLHSKMLYDIANASGGGFGFIPDSTMVGTVFINALSNSMTSEVTKTFDESIDQVIIRYTTVLRSLLEEEDDRVIPLQVFLAYLAEVLDDAKSSGDARLVAFVEDLIIDCSPSDDPNIGQVMKAINSDFFKKWGKHYLFSLLSAFENRICINFKDKCMQNFKTKAFIEEQKRVENVFIQLPPPRPSNLRRITGGGGYARPVTDMQNYYNVSGGCFGSKSRLLCVKEDGEPVVQIGVGSVRKGMLLCSDKGVSAVECVVRLPYKGKLYIVGGFHLTSYHPLMIGGQSYFPCELDDVSSYDIDGFVYDFVLVNRGLLKDFVQKETFAATLGHGVTMEKFQHNYYGTDRVLKDLKKCRGWSEGSVLAENYELVRDTKTMLVCGMRMVETL